ncbi:hypothetical protein [Dickeya solani]|uniref:Uncharacterized protein n=1 Tax=Dickeya solani TaxID=1089444 RepID=A0AAX4F444_9GAMM|nr:hypothetical protein [Dickeya solani]MCZ0791850.1 hypothetical protein [Dickeya solani]WOA54253.1 hypothetical protein RXA29_08555 [Dickeya solani]
MYRQLNVNASGETPTTVMPAPSARKKSAMLALIRLDKVPADAANDNVK